MHELSLRECLLFWFVKYFHKPHDLRFIFFLLWFYHDWQKALSYFLQFLFEHYVLGSQVTRTLKKEKNKTLISTNSQLSIITAEAKYINCIGINRLTSGASNSDDTELILTNKYSKPNGTF